MKSRVRLWMPLCFRYPRHGQAAAHALDLRRVCEAAPTLLQGVISAGEFSRGGQPVDHGDVAVAGEQFDPFRFVF